MADSARSPDVAVGETAQALANVELHEHALQGEMPVALERERTDFVPVAVFGRIERDPAVVAHVRRNLEARVRRQQALSIDAHPEAQFQALNHQIGSFLGAWLGGKLYEMNGSYDIVWWLSVALGVFAAVVNWPVSEAPILRPAQPVPQPA